MTNQEKTDMLTHVRRLLRRVAARDLGPHTAFVERAIEQIEFAINDLDAEERAFQDEIHEHQHKHH
jgi:hypothetical protein